MVAAVGGADASAGSITDAGQEAVAAETATAIVTAILASAVGDTLAASAAARGAQNVGVGGIGRAKTAASGAATIITAGTEADALDGVHSGQALRGLAVGRDSNANTVGAIFRCLAGTKATTAAIITASSVERSALAGKAGIASIVEESGTGAAAAGAAAAVVTACLAGAVGDAGA